MQARTVPGSVITSSFGPKEVVGKYVPPQKRIESRPSAVKSDDQVAIKKAISFSQNPPPSSASVPSASLENSGLVKSTPLRLNLAEPIDSHQRGNVRRPLQEHLFNDFRHQADAGVPARLSPSALATNEDMAEIRSARTSSSQSSGIWSHTPLNKADASIAVPPLIAKLWDTPISANHLRHLNDLPEKLHIMESKPVGLSPSVQENEEAIVLPDDLDEPVYRTEMRQTLSSAPYHLRPTPLFRNAHSHILGQDPYPHRSQQPPREAGMTHQYSPIWNPTGHGALPNQHTPAYETHPPQGHPSKTSSWYPPLDPRGPIFGDLNAEPAPLVPHQPAYNPSAAYPPYRYATPLPHHIQSGHGLPVPASVDPVQADYDYYTQMFHQLQGTRESFNTHEDFQRRWKLQHILDHQHQAHEKIQREVKLQKILQYQQRTEKKNKGAQPHLF